jgi:hypothetical protein
MEKPPHDLAFLRRALVSGERIRSLRLIALLIATMSRFAFDAGA